VIVFSKKEKRILLVKRGKKAQDMKFVWALPSGKVNENDLSSNCKAGKRLTSISFRRAAVRELNEELNLKTSPRRLELIEKFTLEKGAKKIFFAFFGLEIENSDICRIVLSDGEIEKYKFFSLGEFQNEKNLGDAISLRKEILLKFLQSRFAQK